MHHDTVLGDDTITKKTHATQTEIGRKPFDRFRSLYLHFLLYTYSFFECEMFISNTKDFLDILSSS